MAIIYSKGKDQPVEVANPARGQLNREKYISLSPFKLVFRLLCMVISHIATYGSTG